MVVGWWCEGGVRWMFEINQGRRGSVGGVDKGLAGVQGPGVSLLGIGSALGPLDLYNNSLTADLTSIDEKKTSESHTLGILRLVGRRCKK